MCWWRTRGCHIARSDSDAAAFQTRRLTLATPPTRVAAPICVPLAKKRHGASLATRRRCWKPLP